MARGGGGMKGDRVTGSRNVTQTGHNPRKLLRVFLLIILVYRMSPWDVTCCKMRDNPGDKSAASSPDGAA
eukprot:1328397-Amorphochlora_amoeboformis.AAC.2